MMNEKETVPMHKQIEDMVNSEMKKIHEKQMEKKMTDAEKRKPFGYEHM